MELDAESEEEIRLFLENPKVKEVVKDLEISEFPSNHPEFLLPLVQHRQLHSLRINNLNGTGEFEGRYNDNEGQDEEDNHTSQLSPEVLAEAASYFTDLLTLERSIVLQLLRIDEPSFSFRDEERQMTGEEITEALRGGSTLSEIEQEIKVNMARETVSFIFNRMDWLTSAHLSGSGALDLGVLPKYIVKGIQRNQNLKEVTISLSGIFKDLEAFGFTGPDANLAPQLAETIKNHRSLNTLRLESPGFDGKGVEIFAEGIKGNRSLKNLELTQVNFGKHDYTPDGGASIKALMDALAMNQKIESLTVKHSTIAEEESVHFISALSEMLGKNRSLKLVEIAEVWAPKEAEMDSYVRALDALADALSTNKVLTKLDLSRLRRVKLTEDDSNNYNTRWANLKRSWDSSDPVDAVLLEIRGYLSRNAKLSSL